MSSRTPKPAAPLAQLTNMASRDPNDNWSADERELLQAARQDRMSDQLQQRMQAALTAQLAQAYPPAALPPEAAPTQSGAHFPRFPHGLFGSKLTVWGTLTVIALGTFAVLGSKRAPDAAAPKSQLAAAATQASSAALARLPDPLAPPAKLGVNAAPAAQPMAARPARVAVVVTRRASVEAASASVPTRPVRVPVLAAPATMLQPTAAISPQRAVDPVRGADASQPATAALGGGVTATGSDQLRLEAQLLDGARNALAQGALANAAGLLGRYAARFEHGVLHPESEALNIELKVRRGEPAAAKAQATRFLREYPQHPLRDRVRALSAIR